MDVFTTKMYSWLLVALLASASPLVESGANCTEGGCNDDIICPPDSTHDVTSPTGGCVCVPERCVTPPCHYPSTRKLKKAASGDPGDCCDVYECVPPPELNCSQVVCPKEEEECPADSYRLPSHKSAEECCTVPQGCQCLPAPCPVGECAPGTWAKVVRPGSGKPGTCCPLYKCVAAESNTTCVSDGKVMQNGSTWWRTQCNQCRCINGLIFCNSTPKCDPLPSGCTTTIVPSGECCPVCADEDAKPPGGCVSASGEIILNGQSWQDDDCTSCICHDGVPHCQAYMCEACANPRYEPGECCPRCDLSTVVTLPPHCPALTNCSLRCVHGFVRDSAGCFTCHCQQDECLLECPHGYVQDIHGNKLCDCAAPVCPLLTNCRKSCPHGYKVNKAGCEVCRCDTCKSLDKCTKRCAHGLVTNNKGCPVCKCKPLESEASTNITISNVTLCVSEDGVWRDDGETWFDGCRQCYCMAGREMCSLLSCPPTACSNVLYNTSKDCCPTCPGTQGGLGSHMVCQGETPGKIHVEGETWRLSPCVECVCQSGRALCHSPVCPAAPCKRPLPPAEGQCCPTCPPELLNTSFSLTTTCDGRKGQTSWREGNCVSCACDNGEPTCFTELCDHQVNCKHALQVKNQCCPLCVDKPQPHIRKECNYGNVTYTVGDSWEVDECMTCMCLSPGEISCTKLICSVTCSNPIKKPGICCLVCNESDGSSSAREAIYIIVLSVVVCATLCLGFYVARQCRLRRHQLKLHGYGCPPPQYQYKYVPTYDGPQPQSIRAIDKSSLAPV